MMRHLSSVSLVGNRAPVLQQLRRGNRQPKAFRRVAEPVEDRVAGVARLLLHQVRQCVHRLVVQYPLHQERRCVRALVDRFLHLPVPVVVRRLRAHAKVAVVLQVNEAVAVQAEVDSLVGAHRAAEVTAAGTQVVLEAVPADQEVVSVVVAAFRVGELVAAADPVVPADLAALAAALVVVAVVAVDLLHGKRSDVVM